MKLKYIDFTIVHNKESVVPAKNYESKYKETTHRETCNMRSKKCSIISKSKMHT